VCRAFRKTLVQENTAQGDPGSVEEGAESEPLYDEWTAHSQEIDGMIDLTHPSLELV